MTEKVNFIPSFYRPGGLPLRWQDEQSGTLSAAVMAFFDHALDPEKPFVGMQVALVRDYLRYYISAPCWDAAADEETLKEHSAVHGQLQQVKTPEEIRAWIMSCLHLGIDPL